MPRALVKPVLLVQELSKASNRFELIVDHVGRREVETLLTRCVLTEGVYRRPGQRPVKVSGLWAMVVDETSLIDLAFAQGDDANHAIFEPFVPAAFDHDNYMVVMPWLAEMTRDRRTAVVLRAYRLSWLTIGDRIGRRGRTEKQAADYARSLYKAAVNKAWAAAIRDRARLRRLPRSYWDFISRPR